MKEITEISSQKKNEDRLNIYLDGEFAFGVEYATAVKLGLKVGRLLTEEDIAEIEREEGETAAFDRGLKYAVKKTVSEKQMREYLARNGFSQAASSEAIKKLKSYGYADDVKFAQSYISTYAKERGTKRLELELKKAGVSEEIIENALSKVDDGDACDKCIEKFLRTHKSADKQKLINYLLYRGFEWESINEALERSEL